MLYTVPLLSQSNLIDWTDLVSPLATTGGQNPVIKGSIQEPFVADWIQ